MKRLSILLVLVAVAWGTFSYADFAGSGFSNPPLPSMAGQSGKVLTNNGSVASWGTAGAGSGDMASGTWDNDTNGAIDVAKGGTNATSAGAALTSLGAEAVANKSDNVSLGTSATLYPTQNAVKSYADTGLALKAPIASPTFTGTLTVAAGTDGSRGLFLNSNTTATCAAGDNGVKFVGGVMFFCYNGTLKSPLDNSSSPATIGAAATNQTMNIGTTAVAINRASAALVLTGITSIDGSAATATTAGNLSGTPAVPNGTTATTQSPNDNTGKIATNAYVDQRYEYERVVIDQPALSDNIIIAGPLDRAWTIDNVVVVIQDNTGKLSTAATDNVTFNVQYGATSAFGSPTNVFTSNVVATGAVDYSAALNNTAPLTNYYIRVVFSVVNMTNKKFYIRIKYHRT